MSASISASISNVDSTKQVLELTGSSNYYTWSKMLQNHLKGKLLHEALESKASKKKLTDDAYDQASAMVLCILQQNVSAMIRETIIDCDLACDAWDVLKKRYNRTDESTQIKLDTELINIRIDSKQSIDDFKTLFNNKVNQYKLAGGTITDAQVKNRFVQAIGDRYPDLLKYSIMSKNLDDIDTITDNINTIEIKFGSSTLGGDEVALATKFNTHKFGNRNNGTSSSGNHSKQQNFPGKVYNTHYSIAKDQCRYCKEVGHWATDCPAIAAKHLSKPKAFVTTFVDSTNDGNRNADFINMHVTDSNVSSSVILDSAATSHMTGDKSKLVNIKAYNPVKYVRWCDGSKLRVLGVGDLQLHLSVNNKLLKASFSNTQLVENMKTTLISEVVLDQKGYTYKGGNGKRKFYLNNNLRMEAEIVDGLYGVKLFDYPSVPTVHNELVMMNAIKCTQDSTLLHKQFVHIAPTKLQHMIDNGIVSGIKKIDWTSSKCISCDIGHHTRMPLTGTTVSNATRPLYRIHTDVCGPVKPASLGGGSYVLVLIDEYTNYTWAHIIKNKSDVAEQLKQWKLQVENESEYKIKYIRCDNGGEFKNKVLNDLWTGSGVIIEYTAAHTPEQNGKSERMNRTIFDKVRTIMYDSKIESELWAQAVDTVVYTLNRVTSKCTPHHTPYELYYNSKPDASNLHVFGCLALVHRFDTHSKIEPKAIECQFVGYTNNDRVYRVRNLETGKVFDSGHVTFHDNVYAKLKQPVKPTTVLQIANYDIQPVTVVDSLAHQAPPEPEPVVVVDNAQAESNVNSAADGIPVHQAANAPSAQIQNVPASRSRSRTRTTSKAPKPQREYVVDKITDQYDTYTDGITRYKTYFKNYKTPQWLSRDKFVDNDGRVTEAFEQWESSHQTQSSNETETISTNRLAAGNSNDNNASNEEDERATFSYLIEDEEYHCMYVDEMPTTVKQALARPDGKHFAAAMSAELQALSNQSVFIEVAAKDIPANSNILTGKWVFTIKTDQDGNAVKYKGRLVIRGFQQRDGIDFNSTEIYAPVVRYSNVRLLLAIAAIKGLHVQQLDVDTAFLNGTVEEDIYMYPPDGYSILSTNKTDVVLQLKKALYGLKQAPAVWYKQVNSLLVDTLKFKRVSNEYGLYIYNQDGIYCLISVYVDDKLIACNNSNFLMATKQKIFDTWKCKDIGNVKTILGCEIERDMKQKLLYISQCKYIREVLQRFNMTDCKCIDTPCSEQRLSQEDCPASDSERQHMSKVPYREAIGALLFVTLSRPDIAYAVNQCSRFVSNPGLQHWTAVKRIMRYLKHTLDYKLKLGGHDTLQLAGYCDADWSMDLDDRKSTTGYVFKLGNSVISWGVRKQRTVALSSTEAEYMAASEATKELLYLRSILKELDIEQTESTVLYVDNRGAIDLARNPVYHDRSKHIDMRYHFIRERVQDNTLQIEHVPGDNNVADIMTKPLARVKHTQYTSDLGICKHLVDSHSGSVGIGVSSTAVRDQMQVRSGCDHSSDHSNRYQ